MLSEEDIKRIYITPAIEGKGWASHLITMETQLTDGQVVLFDGHATRKRALRADYVLWLNPSTPLAVVEAKSDKYTPSDGIQQAIEYAHMLHVPFAYSSNGHAFVERDFTTGCERTLPMDAFPTPDELAERYRRDGKVTPAEEQAMSEPFCVQQNVYPPRYYQRVSANEVMRAIARGQQRLLLVMATGTGKTYIAFQLVWRLLRAGLCHKVLYLADRNILVDQSIVQDFQPLEGCIHKVNYARDRGNQSLYSAYQLYFALYQQLTGQEEDADHYRELFPPDYFDLVIVDECHRGSAKDDSTWRNILNYFTSAIHLGMTATPKETRYQSSIAYFGEPLYTYSLAQGIKDGFLAPFRVVNVRLNISDGWRPTLGQRDIYGREIEDRIYNNSDFDYSLKLADRDREVAQQITAYLRATDRMTRTIVFCADEDHAERIRMALVNENTDLVRQHHDYVVRITGSDVYGKSKLDYFISKEHPFPVIATTSRLLSTGVDTKMAGLIVLDKQIASMIEFKQIIGRGTRLVPDRGKMHFTIMDFRGVTRLFADPDWDGPIIQDPDFPSKPSSPEASEPRQPRPQPPADLDNRPYVVDRHGCRVYVCDHVVSIFDPDFRLLRSESITDFTRRTLTDVYPTLRDFHLRWQADGGREEIMQRLADYGVDLRQMKIALNMPDVDDFDLISYLAFNRPTLTRRQRAQAVKRRDAFGRYGQEARRVIDSLLDKYAEGGIAELDNIYNVLQNDPFRRMGTPRRIAEHFGGEQPFMQAIDELKHLLYT